VIESKLVQDGRQPIVVGDHVADGMVRKVIGGAVEVSLLQTAILKRCATTRFEGEGIGRPRGRAEIQAGPIAYPWEGSVALFRLVSSRAGGPGHFSP
jgi:hypothetical protein